MDTTVVTEVPAPNVLIDLAYARRLQTATTITHTNTRERAPPTEPPIVPKKLEAVDRKKHNYAPMSSILT